MIRFTGFSLRRVWRCKAAGTAEIEELYTLEAGLYEEDGNHDV
ncbi:hypothetical protein [Paenibacillus larvae]|nr:hypothetical protein [Paenibacillus larvae]MDT2193385.1 hypothetical protein [Paenibacillus larvae]